MRSHRCSRRNPEWDALPAHVRCLVRTLLRRCLTRGTCPENGYRTSATRGIELEDALQRPVAAQPGGEGWRRSPLASSRRRGLGFALLAGALAYRLLTRTTSGGLPAGEAGSSIPDLGWRATAQEDSYVPFAVSPGRPPAGLTWLSGRRCFLRPLDEAEARPLPGLGGYDPFFSPDGKWLAFWASGSLKKAPIGGGAVPVVLCEAEDLVGGVWSSTGRDVSRFNEITVRCCACSANGGQPQPATRLLAGELGHLWPELLPARKRFSSLYARVLESRTFASWRSLSTAGSAGPGRRRRAGAIRGKRALGVRAWRDSVRRAIRSRGAPPGRTHRPGPRGGGGSGPTADAQFAFSPEGSLFYVSAAGPARRSLVLVDRRGVASPLPLDPRPYVLPGSRRTAGASP